MKRIVLTFGLIAGAVLSLMMLIGLLFHDAIGFDRGVVVGYTSMVLAFLLVFFGVRSYRDNVGNGSVKFGRALAVGSLIALIASLCYVATWEVVYFTYKPDFLAQYQAHIVDKMRRDGATEAALAEKKAEMDKVAVYYNKPIYNAAMTLVEPLPVGLVFALVSAGVLSRRRQETI